MHKWQLDCINNNLDKLIEATRCTTMLVANLQKERVISPEEAEALQDSGKTHTEKASLLYRLIVTRTDFYTKLKTALYETRQTAALCIITTPEIDQLSTYKAIQLNEADNLSTVDNTVYTVKGKFGTRDAVIKLFDKDYPNSLNQALNEVEILCRTDWHENVVRCFIAKMITFGQESIQYFALALDYETTLDSFYTENEPGYLSNAKPQLIKQVLSAVEFLHSNRILHANLLPDCVFITQRNPHSFSVKVGEFGFSRFIKPSDEDAEFSLKLLESEAAGSFYTPEVLAHVAGRQSRKSLNSVFLKLGFGCDVFCLGSLIYYILSGGLHPFGDLYERVVYIPKGLISLDSKLLDSFSCVGKQRFTEAFSRSPLDRPTVKVLRRSLAKINWRNVSTSLKAKNNNEECTNVLNISKDE